VIDTKLAITRSTVLMAKNLVRVTYGQTFYCCQVFTEEMPVSITHRDTKDPTFLHPLMARRT
jgi:hypothetical protein